MVNVDLCRILLEVYEQVSLLFIFIDQGNNCGVNEPAWICELIFQSG